MDWFPVIMYTLCPQSHCLDLLSRLKFIADVSKIVYLFHQPIIHELHDFARRFVRFFRALTWNI